MTPGQKYESNDKLLDPKTGLLRNKKNILDVDELEEAETSCLMQAYQTLSAEYSDTHVFGEKDVQHLHHVFLGPLYEWAGSYRAVDISSPDIRWCHAQRIPGEMEKFGKMLSQLTPFSRNISRGNLVERLAKIHGELIVIHPFRDGNGRVTRLLCDVLLMQGGHPPIEKQIFKAPAYQEKYFAAIREVWRKAEYSKLIELVGGWI